MDIESSFAEQLPNFTGRMPAARQISREVTSECHSRIRGEITGQREDQTNQARQELSFPLFAPGNFILEMLLELDLARLEVPATPPTAPVTQ